MSPTNLTSEDLGPTAEPAATVLLKTARMEIEDADLSKALASLAQRILSMDDICALLVPLRLPGSGVIMPTLVSDPERLADADFLAPAFALNAARMVSRLTRKPSRGRVAVWLRPCEIRAFIELVKLHQGHTEGLILLGGDCLGAYSNQAYAAFAQAAGKESTRRFYHSVLTGQGGALEEVNLSPACQACVAPLPNGADLALMLYGQSNVDHLILGAQTETGLALLDRLNLPTAQVSSDRAAAVATLIDQRRSNRDQLFARTQAATGTLEKLATYLARCVNCYNCRVACPVCYCRECVFGTDVFDHDPAQYLDWSQRKGALKMPTDTLFYHLTRLAHMSTACVGCGQCDNACPNDIKIMALFTLVAHRTQAAFDYQAGRRIDEAPPQSVFKEKELDEVVGLNE